MSGTLRTADSRLLFMGLLLGFVEPLPASLGVVPPSVAPDPLPASPNVTFEAQAASHCRATHMEVAVHRHQDSRTWRALVHTHGRGYREIPI